MLALIQSQQDVAKAQKDYTKAVKEHGAKSAEAKSAELDLASAILDSAGAAATAQGVFGGQLTPALKDILRAGGLTAKQIHDIELAFIAAKKQGDRFATTYNATANLTVKVTGLKSIHFDAEGNPTGHASGGVMTGSGLQTYNRGEEIAALPDGSTIIPAGMSRQMAMNGGGSGPTEIKLGLEFSGAEDAFVRFMQEVIRHKGGGDIALAFI
jgi:hypothetical protein